MLCDCESINMRSLEKMRMTSRGTSCPGLLSCPVSTLPSKVGRGASPARCKPQVGVQ